MAGQGHALAAHKADAPQWPMIDHRHRSARKKAADGFRSQMVPQHLTVCACADAMLHYASPALERLGNATPKAPTAPAACLAAHNWGNYHGTWETVPFVNGTLEWRGGGYRSGLVHREWCASPLCPFDLQAGGWGGFGA